jgi:hypothetical protein
MIKEQIVFARKIIAHICNVFLTLLFFNITSGSFFNYRDKLYKKFCTKQLGQMATSISRSNDATGRVAFRDTR